jgi:leader peptidase (prepilin peptidase)/N-methyltransferase
VKLMAACGLLLGWKLIIFAFLLGCVLGAVIHVIRMKVSGESRVLALGPYLSMGTFIAAIWGNQMISWYLGQFI